MFRRQGSSRISEEKLHTLQKEGRDSEVHRGDGIVQTLHHRWKDKSEMGVKA